MRKSRQFWLWVLLLVQAGCSVFFVFDATFDWFGLEASVGARHFHSFEFLIALVLLAGLAVTVFQIRDLARRQEAMRRQLRVASGAFAELIESQFDAWALSPSERDVALLAIKGLSVAEIAALRNTREGTIKAQSAAVYRKAGVSGRLQLISYFIEELLSDPLFDRGSVPAF